MSARVLVRLPADLHDVLVQRAEQQGVSVNTLIVSLLAGGVGFKLVVAKPKRKKSS